MKKISVIVPVYNSEKYIEKCLNSIKNQTYKNLEVIIINDFSTDRSKDIIEHIVKEDNRFILLNHKKNKGVSIARNTGIEHSTGEYILFVDSDDYLSFSYLDEIMKVSENTSSDVVETPKVFHYTTNKGKELQFTEMKVKDKIIEKGSIYEDLGFQTELRYVISILYKKELLANISFDEGLKCYEDALYNAIIKTKIKKYVFAPIYGYHYIQTPFSLTRGETSKKNIDFLTAGKKIKNYYKNENIMSDSIEDKLDDMIVNNVLFILFFKVGRLNINKQQKKQCIKELITEIKNCCPLFIKKSIKNKIIFWIIHRINFVYVISLIVKKINIEDVYFKLINYKNPLK